MKEDAFKSYLAQRFPGEAKRAVRDNALSRCRRVERFEGNLDEHFDKDGMDSLLYRLEYSQRDEDLELQPRHSIPIEGKKTSSMREGTASLKNAIAIYCDFRKGYNPTTERGAPHARSSKHGLRNHSRSSGVKVSYLPGFGPNGRIARSKPDHVPEPEADLEPMGMGEITGLWREYMDVTNRITAALGRSSNIVGEYAERLVAEHYGGSLLAASHKSADIELPDGRLVQVKSRIPRQTLTTSLSSIRSWDFDLLVVVLFDRDGGVLKAVEYEAAAAKRHARRDEHQNSDLIVTTDEFLNDPLARDITADLARLLGNSLEA